MLTDMGCGLGATEQQQQQSSRLDAWRKEKTERTATNRQPEEGERARKEGKGEEKDAR
jgi:hypothetical protein